MLAFEKNNNLIQGRFIRNVIIKALPAALTNFLTISALIVFGNIIGIGDKIISTVTTLTLAAVGFMVLFKISRPFNRYKTLLALAMPVGLYMSAHHFNRLFELQKINLEITILFAVFTVLAFVLLNALTIAVNTAERFITPKQ